MSDIRILGSLALIAFFSIGALCAKAFGFSIEWVCWPFMIIGAIFMVICIVMSGWSE